MLCSWTLMVSVGHIPRHSICFWFTNMIWNFLPHSTTNPCLKTMAWSIKFGYFRYLLIWWPPCSSIFLKPWSFIGDWSQQITWIDISSMDSWCYYSCRLLLSSSKLGLSWSSIINNYSHSQQWLSVYFSQQH